MRRRRWTASWIAWSSLGGNLLIGKSSHASASRNDTSRSTKEILLHVRTIDCRSRQTLLVLRALQRRECERLARDHFGRAGELIRNANARCDKVFSRRTRFPDSPRTGGCRRLR